MGEWYRDYLGFQIIRSAGNDEDGVSFVVDDGGNTILELGRLPEGPPLDSRNLLPLQLHIAVECEDPTAEAARLVAAGAEFLGESPRNARPGEKILLRDPWGYTIQLVNRKNDLVSRDTMSQALNAARQENGRRRGDC
jgi:catechol 2,3-dioxygenase-like lactoylglutathione lyase family enzyme